MKFSEWYERKSESTLRCTLCPHLCNISEGQTGICHVRSNVGGSLISENYGMISAAHLDPIEKKPLYHFYPGLQVFSVGSVGCNLRCQFCQNCEISQVPSVKSAMGLRRLEPEQLVEQALAHQGNIGIAYTYNEPTVWFEFMFDTAMLAKDCSLRNVMVTNGFINPEPLTRLLNVIDAFSIDIKGFTGEFYKKVTSSKLEPVKKAINIISKSEKHLELVNLVIPGLNDNRNGFEEMVKWISGETGRDTVLHLSRYYPMHKMQIEATPASLLEELHDIALKYLNYVYLGNINTWHSNTYCPVCSALTIIRKGYIVDTPGLDNNGRCNKCGELIIRYMS
jgi:pyruvate formate lyase activating enzyme